VSDEIAHLPAWVRRKDGSQIPFEPDRICQALFAAAESLGQASAFLIRELTDVVLHFLAKDPFDSIPTTAQIAVEVEKIVREVGQPALALRYAEMQAQRTSGEKATTRVTLECAPSASAFVADCLEAYALEAIFSRDVAAAVREGLVHLGGLDAPESLSSLVLETTRLAELPWWLALDDWRAAGGERWVVESPEWLCTPQMHPAVTPHLCERLLALPMLAARQVELHLNIAEPPSWAPGHQMSPLFALSEDEVASPERTNFLDGLIERWKSLEAPRVPAIAWHLHERSFSDEAETRQLQGLVRLALQGKPVRFLFDRPRTPIVLAEGLDRKCPGVLLQVELDLPALADRPEVARDGATFLRKLPSLVRIAVSAAEQKRRRLRNLPADAPLKRRFLIERAAAAIVPIGLEAVVDAVTGARLVDSPLALDFARRVVASLKDTLMTAGRSLNLDLRLDLPALAVKDAAAPESPLLAAGKLHAQAGAGNAVVPVDDSAVAIHLLQQAWLGSAVARVQLVNKASDVQQGELLVAHE
jgi:hypothetical protein